MKIFTTIALSILCMGCTISLPLVSDHAEELGNKFEGDMILSKTQEAALTGHRNGLLEEQYRWPNKTLYYRIVTDNFTSNQLAHIRKALDTIEGVSCLKFKEADENATSYVRVLGDEGGCFSEVGYTGSVQDLNLAPNELEKGCFRLGTIMHEFLHALGFFHMQSAVERDDFVEIVWKNIQPGMEHNFEKYESDFVTNFDVLYDYGSVMHYPETAFSINGQRTIVPLEEGATIGQREKLSPSDIKKLQRMYGCE